MDVKKLQDTLGYRSYEAIYTVPTDGGSNDCKIIILGYRKPTGVMEGQGTFSSTGNVSYKSAKAPIVDASVTTSGCTDIQLEEENMIPNTLELANLTICGINGTRYYVNPTEKKITSDKPVTIELTDKLRKEYGLSYVPFDEFKIGMDMKSKQSE